MEVSRPLMHAIADRHDVTVYLSRVVGPSSTQLLDWAGAGFQGAGFQMDVYFTAGRRYFPLVGAPGIVLAAYSEESRKTLLAEFSKVGWHRKPSASEISARIAAMRADGFAAGRENLLRGLTRLSAPILSQAGDLVMVMTGAGHAPRLEGAKLDALGCDMVAGARRISDALRMVRLD